MTAYTGPGIYADMSEADYHSDPVPGGSLSSSGARRILQNPARFRWEQANPPVPTLAQQVGSALHTKVLGRGWEIVTHPDEHLTPSGAVSKGAAAVAWEAEQLAAGRIILTRSEMARVNAMAEAVLAHRTARALLELPGASEVSVFGVDPETGVTMRARFDRLTDKLGVDVKTTAGLASVDGFGRDAAKYGYPVQEAHYADAHEFATGYRPPMQFLVIEKQPPHFVAVHEFDELTRMTAREVAAKARTTYAACKASDIWPAYGDAVLTPAIPGWWFDSHDDTEDMVI